MELKYKNNFEDARKFWRNFWENSETTRPALLYPLLKEGMNPVKLPNPISLVDGNISEFCDSLERFFESHELSEDMVPGIVLSLGADHFAGLLGADLAVDLKNSTTWVKPCISDWDECRIRVDWNSKIARRTLECIEEIRRRFDGKLIVSPTHLQGNLDCLAALRGVENLLLDLVDCPDKIHRALDEVNVAFAEVVGVFRKEFDTDKWGSINRHGLYQPGFPGLLQSDFSCMINPEMFEEFVLPSLKFEADIVDYAEYHLDGPGAIIHVEAVCSIKKIKVVQWQPGAAMINSDWGELHKRIDRGGCGQYFFRPGAEKCRWIMENMTSKNICLDLTSKSSEEIDEIRDITNKHVTGKR